MTREYNECGVEETIQDSERKPVFLPEGARHKAHRVIYPLPKTQGGKDTYAWAAFTHFENTAVSHRATLSMDPKKMPSGGVLGGVGGVPTEVLAAVPVLIDLAIGSTGGTRASWTFSSRHVQNNFYPEEVVNYFNEGERLSTVVTSFGFPDVVNPAKGDIAPKQVSMDDPKGETARVIGKAEAAPAPMIQMPSSLLSSRGSPAI